MGAATKTKRRVKTAAELAESLLERRHPAVARRLSPRERSVELAAAALFAVVAIAMTAAAGPSEPAGTAALDQTTLTVLALALIAQCSGDLVASSAREYFGARISPAELLPVLALVYVIDVTLSPIGFLGVLATEVYDYAYLLAIAPAALLGRIARERSARIAHELALERAFRRSTRALDARADDLRRQAGRLQRGEAEPENRAQLERILLATTVEALQADAGRLSEIGDDGALHTRLAIGGHASALEAAEQVLGAPQANALAIGVGHSHVLAVMRAASPFSAVERDLLEHLAAQAAVTLENVRLEELMRRTEAELRAILEGVADAVAAEDPEGRLVFVNAAATELLDGARDLSAALGVAPGLLPGPHVFDGEQPEPLVVKHHQRWSRVKASPVLEGGDARLAISVVEDITEIKQAEEAQRFLAQASSALASSLRVEQTLPEVARLAAAHCSGSCAIVLDAHEVARAGERGEPSVTLPLHGGSLTLSGQVDPGTAGELALRVGGAVENARLYRAREAIAHTLQQSLLPPELPEIPGLETAALYRAAGEANEVGGDFYDLFSTGEREWFAVIGDVCGKGAEAAAVTALARYTIRAAVTRHRSPAGILRWLNAAMLRQEAGRFLTLAVVRMQLDRGRVSVTVACGGHWPPRILRASGHVDAVGGPGTIVGVLPEIEAEDRVARLSPGDTLVLYTDGLTEARAPHIMTPGEVDAVVAGAHGRDARGIVEYLSAQAPDPLRDDVALLAIRAHPLL